jgi:glutamine synthetase
MERKSVPQSPQEVLVLCRQHDVKAIDLRVTDSLGQWRHKTIPVSQLTEQAFEDGFNFEGANFPGWESPSLLLVPLPETACIDPFAGLPTLGLICSIQDPITREEFSWDPRQIARKAEYFLACLGIADSAYFGPEPQFYIFDSVEFGQTGGESYYRVANNHEVVKSKLGHPLDRNSTFGYMQSAPLDPSMSMRCEMMQALVDCGIKVESHQYENGVHGQAKIAIGYDSLVDSADNVMFYKHIVRQVASRHGKTATFMPKPIAGENGSGMHTHLSWWKNGEPMFAGNGYGGLSESGLHALGGILRHGPAILAITNPTTNSYRRLMSPAAPAFLSYSQGKSTTACRIPLVSPSPKSKRIEFRCADPSCNPYLAFSALLMAAIDGVQNKIHPGEPMDRNDSPNKSSTKVPSSLEGALSALAADYDFLLRGDVFTEECILAWIEYKRRNDVEPMNCNPNPLEYCKYFNA